MKDTFRSFIEKHSEIWKFIKFSFTGISTSLLDLALFSLFLYVFFRSLNQVPVTDNPVLSFLGIRCKGYMYAYFFINYAQLHSVIYYEQKADFQIKFQSAEVNRSFCNNGNCDHYVQHMVRSIPGHFNKRKRPKQRYS